MTAVGMWAQVALSVTWQMAALAALALLCERVLRLRQPRVRHALWWFVLAAPLLLTPVRLWLAHHQAALAVTVPALLVTAARPEMSLPLTASEPLEVGTAVAVLAAPSTPLNLAATVALLWLAGSAALLMRLAAGHRRARRILDDSQPVPEGEALTALRELCAQARLARPVALRASASVSSVVLYGLIQPVILTPSEWLAELEPRDMRALLAHEVAHVRRRDVLANLLQRAAEALLFFHPAAWLAGRRIGLAREELCDAWALRQSATRSSYARSLALAAERAQGRLAMATVGLAESRFTLLQRVEAIMKREGTGRTSRLALIALAAVVLVTAAAFAAVQLRGESAGGGGGGIRSDDVGGGGGGGWHGQGSPPSGGAAPPQTGRDDADVRTPYQTSTGYALKPGDTPLPLLTIADLDHKQSRHYAVGKRVTDYPDQEDLSLPELSYATFMRASARGDEGIWRRLSTPRVASDPRLPPVDAPLEEVSPTDVKLYLGRKIVEVYVYQGRRAEVVGAVLYEDGTLDGYELRSLELQDGQWLNRGSDGGGSSLERTRNRAAHLFLYEERRASREKLARDTALRYPLSFTMAAEGVLADLQKADYAYYLSPDCPEDAWRAFPVDYYTPKAERRTRAWVEWVCTTFSKNPIVAVKLGKAFRNQDGNPAVPYQLTLQDGQVLRGDLQFELLMIHQESAQWIPRGGLDWHTPKKDTQ